MANSEWRGSNGNGHWNETPPIRYSLLAIRYSLFSAASCARFFSIMPTEMIEAS